MALPTIAGVVRAAVQGTVPSGQRWQNVVHFQYAAGASAPGPTEMDILHTSFVRLYSGAAYTSGAAWLTFCPTGVTLSKISYLPLDGVSQSYDKTLALAGSGGANASPSECAAVLTLRTAKRGRRNRGRIYLPCPMQGTFMDANGRLVATTPTSIIAQWNGMMAALVSGQWAPVVASYGHSYLRVPHSRPPSYTISTWTPYATPVTTVSMDTDVDVVRARKR